MTDADSRVAVVTGASKGIGLAVTQQLLNAGCKVYGLSRSKSPIQNDNLSWFECNLADPDDIRTALAQIHEHQVHVLVSNAGVAYDEPASAVTVESYHRTFSVNVLAPMLVVEVLKDKIRSATIISVSSVSDRMPDLNLALYCSSKAANTLFFNSLAKEFDEALVINLLPDFVDTPMLRAMEDPENFDWTQTLDVDDIALLVDDLVERRIEIASGANVIIANEALKNAFESREKLYGFNTDTRALISLS